MSQRLRRVCELLKRELGVILQRDYAFEGFLVTVGSVDVTPDLRQAHVFISVLGDRKKAHRVINKLNADHGLLQHKVSRRVVLKFTPQLSFRLDDSVERGVRVLTAIQEVDALPTAPPVEDADAFIDGREGEKHD